MTRGKTESRLMALARAHGERARHYTPRTEDYIEVVYELIREKGYARMGDISRYLRVQSPSVTKMLRSLHRQKLLEYEKYRGIRLTPEGERLAKSLRERHGILVKFFSLLGIDEEGAHRTAEGVEHHLDPKVLERLASLVSFLEEQPGWRSHLRERQPTA